MSTSPPVRLNLENSVKGMATEDTCPLQYPDRFHAAVDFVSKPPPKANAMSDDLRLLLFALYKQATQGPCNEPKPWSWNVIETAKWQGWNQLGNMSKAEAMRHYIHQLEQIQPDWWKMTNQGKSQQPIPQESNTSDPDAPKESKQVDDKVETRIRRIQEATAEGSWSTPYLSQSAKPFPRYEHGVEFIDGEMIIVGGNCTGGRYTNDVWTFDFTSLAWTSIACRASTDSSLAPLPPIAGHSLIRWKNSVLVIGGHVKSKDVTERMVVRSLDLKSMTWSVLDLEGDVPPPRGGHSATLLKDKVYVFGGEDLARRPLNDLYVLDLTTMTWTALLNAENGPPAARSAHAAAGYRDRYLLVFGGGSMANCFDDLFILDTQLLRWHSPVVRGRKPSPRAGHSTATLGEHWYVVGGGNNSSGCTDMAYLDLAQLSDLPGLSSQGADSVKEQDLDNIEFELRWTVVGTIPERSYLASEGMSLISISEANVLVAFGGYNGKYSNAVSLFRPREEPETKQDAEAAVSTKVDQGSTEQAASPPSDQKLEALQAKLDSVIKNAATAKEASAQELGIMRRQLVSAQTMLREKEAALAQTKQQLAAEQSKTFKLEAELAEMKSKLEPMADLEKELEMYRKQGELRGKTGGIWGWVAGE